VGFVTLFKTYVPTATVSEKREKAARQATAARIEVDRAIVAQASAVALEVWLYAMRARAPCNRTGRMCKPGGRMATSDVVALLCQDDKAHGQVELALCKRADAFIVLTTPTTR